MKKLLILTLLSACSFNVDAQCSSYTCTNTQLTNGTVSNQSYNGSVCFVGNGTITNSVSFNNWNFLTFNGNFQIQQSLNLNGMSNRVYTNGNSDFDYISMSGADTLFFTGNTTITTLVSNNSTGINRNYIYTPSSVKVSGVRYYPGDTIYTASGTWNNVVVKRCGVGLPVTFFQRIGDLLQWETDEEVTRLMRSEDGGNSWKPVSSLSKGIYKIQPSVNVQFFRLVTNTGISQTIVIQPTMKESSFKCYNMVGQLIEEPKRGVFIKVYSNGIVEKICKF